MILERFLGKLMQGADTCKAFFDYAIEVQPREVGFMVDRGSDAACPQHLLDGRQQTVAVLDHGAIELLAFWFLHGAGLQGLEVKTDGCDRCLQFVRYRVDKGVMLLVAPYLAYQECCIQDDAANDRQGQDRSEKQQDSSAPVEQNPTDV